MQTQIELSKQQLKSKETKARIFRAAKEILQRRGYEELSIKNICKESGVSNGSFYHHFSSKDDLLSYYIEEQPSINPDLLDTPSCPEEAKTAIVLIYINYARYCMELGVTFISHFFTPMNQTLNPDFHTTRPYPIISVKSYLQRAIDAGILPSYLPLRDITTDIRMMVIGNIFEWCLRSQSVHLEQNLRRSLSNYLDGAFE